MEFWLPYLGVLSDTGVQSSRDPEFFPHLRDVDTTFFLAITLHKTLLYLAIS